MPVLCFPRVPLSGLEETGRLCLRGTTFTSLSMSGSHFPSFYTNAYVFDGKKVKYIILGRQIGKEKGETIVPDDILSVLLLEEKTWDKSKEHRKKA